MQEMFVRGGAAYQDVIQVAESKIQLKTSSMKRWNDLFFFLIFNFLIFFFVYYIQHCVICRPSDSTVPTDAGIEPRTVATGALAVRRSNH